LPAPRSGYSGLEQFIYTVSDGERTAQASVTLSVDNSYSGYGTIGTNGNDVLFGGAKGSVFGGAGDDMLIAGLYGGNLAGGQGSDLLIGQFGANLLEGNEDDDFLFGGAGSDTLIGGTGNDLLYGGAGKDTFVFRTGDGSDLIRDFDAGRKNGRKFVVGDTLSLDVQGIESFQDLLAIAVQHTDGVLLDFGGGDEIFLARTRLAALDKDSFTFF